ncbi:hypothetical protein BP5796_08103 [Coleophoma crateriformis]|uniref:NAD(P)-binding domain-containing protein n=1 Tax=Coleophoma crateriformis TaxID=565419 RepID=A0A3D8RDE1_9HELO|nr:hypothetical protein BP5796_08103 [Coleophoma crateriformis]
MPSKIQKVMVIGASGSTGVPIVHALLASGFTVSVLARESSTATYPAQVQAFKTDYSPASLERALQGQDAVVSTLTTTSAAMQTSIIDAAIAAGVQRFIPSEFGIDTATPGISDTVPALAAKVATARYLQSKEATGLEWTGLAAGELFDWAFRFGAFGWDLQHRKVTVFDGGEQEVEATTLAQLSRAVAAILAEEQRGATKNRYVYVNSFTVTQKEVLEIIETLMPDVDIEVTEVKTDELGKAGVEKLASGDAQAAQMGGFEVITAAVYGFGGANNYSKNRGLWNQKLGLPQEDLRAVLAGIVRDYS